MAKIHSSVYILLGIAISVASWIINRSKFILFIYIGFALTIIGITKAVFSKKVEKKGNAKAKEPQIVQHIPRRAQSTKPNLKRCIRCLNFMNFYDNFCSKCGAKARR